MFEVFPGVVYYKLTVYSNPTQWFIQTSNRCSFIQTTETKGVAQENRRGGDQDWREAGD